MGGRGGSSGLGSGNQTKERPKGIALLQGAVEKARTDQLMSAWQTVNKKSMANMTNEEKMVRAVTQDELAKRGAIVYDSKTGSYTKAKSGENIVFYNEKSYRINGIKTAGIGDKEGKIADADWYYGGKWHPVKNVTILIELAKRRRRKS